jgi:protein-S-isoprenylcysteine O-methyltransferase Ste14
VDAPALTDPGDYNGRVHVRKDKTNTRRVAYLTLLLFATSPEWPWFAAGLLSAAVGIALHGWAAGYLARAGYAEREKILTVQGPYRYTRNPYYLAQMTMDLGFFCLAGRPSFFIFYFPVIFFIYRRWVVIEEAFLENQFGDSYRALKQDVPRWRFRITPALARGSDLKFRWTTFRVNRELPRLFSHLGLVTIFVLLFFLQNPFAGLTVLFRITLISAIAIWLLLRDVYPIDVSRKSVGWFVVALCSAAMTALFLMRAPVWQPWSGTGAWISIGAGFGLGLLVWLTALPSMVRKGQTSKPLFTRPICQWYVLALGLGLLSCTFAGVWLGMMGPFTAWALHLAGGPSIPVVPRRFGISFVLLIVIACSSAFAIARQLS